MKFQPPVNPPLDEDDNITEISTIDLISNTLRQTWISEYQDWFRRVHGKDINYRSSPRWDGGVDSMGRNHLPKWPRLAKSILELGLDPVQLVKAQFINAGVQPPLPTSLLTPLSLKRYYSFSKDSKEKFELAFKIQCTNYLIAMRTSLDLYDGDGDRATLAVACNKNLPLSALFRYFVLERVWPNQATIYKKAAIEQYVANREIYNEVWKDIIPESIKREFT